MIMIFVAYLMVDTASSEPTTDTNVQVFNIPSCQHFTAQLHYYCSYEKSGENLLITASHLNTDKISENLCGKYDNQQGIAVDNNILYVDEYMRLWWAW